MNKFLKVGFMLNCLLMFSFVLSAQNISFIGNSKDSKVFKFKLNRSKTQYFITGVGGTNDTLALDYDLKNFKTDENANKHKVLYKILSSVDQQHDKAIRDSILKKVKSKTLEFAIEIKPKRTLIELEKQTIYVESEALAEGKTIYTDSIGDTKIPDGDYNKFTKKDSIKITIKDGKVFRMILIENTTEKDKTFNIFYTYLILFAFFLILIIVVLIYVIRNRSKESDIEVKNKLVYEKENIKTKSQEKEKPNNENNEMSEVLKVDKSNQEILDQLRKKLKINNDEDIVKKLDAIFENHKNYENLINKNNFDSKRSIQEQIDNLITKKLSETEKNLKEKIKQEIRNKYQFENDDYNWNQIIKSIIDKKTETINNEITKLGIDVSSKSAEISKLKGELNKEKSELQVQRNNYSSLMDEKNGLEEMNKQTSLAAKKINEFFIEYQRELNRDNLKEEEKPQIALLQLSKIGLHAISLARVIEKKNTKEDDLNLKLLLGENPSFLSKTSVDSTPNENDAVTRSIILLLKQNHIRSLEGVYVKGKKISD
jgi:hypothetical protein